MLVPSFIFNELRKTHPISTEKGISSINKQSLAIVVRCGYDISGVELTDYLYFQ